MRRARTGTASILVGLALAGLAAPARGQVPPPDAQPVDIRLADARLDTLLERGAQQDLEEAGAVYLDLLGRPGIGVPPEQAGVVYTHLAQLALILPAGVQARVADGDLQKHPDHATFKAGGREALLAWWRSRDPLPASPQNERLAEHLRRVAFAEAHYAHDGRATGLDDRGEVYVRYGSPIRRTVITFNDPKLIDTVFQPGVSVSPSDFPDNEFWLYPHIDNAGYFLFVRDGDHYRIGDTGDLLPPMLQSGFGASGRGKIRAEMALAVLRSVYRQLALEHPDFAARFNEVDLFALRQEENKIGRFLDAVAQQERERNEGTVRRAGARRSGTNASENRDVSFVPPPDPNELAPWDFVQHMIYQGRSEDGQASWRREAGMPEQYTEVLRTAEMLPLSVRTARFLDDDGTTRTEIYWSPDPGGLRLPGNKNEDRSEPDVRSPGHFLVHLTAVQQAAAYRARRTNRKPYLVTDLPDVRDATIPAQTMIVRGDTGLYHLALQWDQHRVLAGEAGGLQVGPAVKVATHRVDSLTALNADERVLEMSDLKPIFVDDPGALYTGEDAAGVPYTPAQIWPELPLGLYFELYHLVFGGDDQTHYTIAYEIARRGEGGLLRFLGRGKEERTVVQTPYTGQNRTAREHVILDFSEWEGTGDLVVRVQVTDDVTGRRVARSLSFELVE